MSNSWIKALKIFNKNKNEWCVPKKGTTEYNEVKKIIVADNKSNNNKVIEVVKTKKETKENERIRRGLNLLKYGTTDIPEDKETTEGDLRSREPLAKQKKEIIQQLRKDNNEKKRFIRSIINSKPEKGTTSGYNDKDKRTEKEKEISIFGRELKKKKSSIIL